MLETFTVITALVGVPSLFRAVVGLGRGRPAPGDDERRLQLVLKGGSLVAIALLTAATLGVFGAWAVAFALCALLSLVRPRWMIPGAQFDSKQGAAAYGAMAGLMLIVWLTMPTQFNPSAGATETLDLVTLGTLLGGRAWLWFARPGAPFRKRRGRRRIDLEDDPAALGADGTGAGQAWWDRVWSQRRAREDASFADAAPMSEAAGPWDDASGRTGRTGPSADPDPDPAPDAAPDPASDPAAADAALAVPGYDPDLLREELAAFRANRALIDRVAIAWPSHTVSEALIHVSVILNETRRFLQDHPDKYRDIRAILVGHAATAADIARLVDRIKSTGEVLDDPDGVAERLFALATLMRETRRKSTQAERDRLKASMAVIDDELSALSAVKDLRVRMAREGDRA
ncbi:hypothetical protein [Roseospira navarrensis]|uniref:Uncharacterized protein n=1 Tax=Roseospira navarrensis TaxID=140058 RepID=A0A7X1ZEH0_9PROT|nr:hypothetical protein [Roseospira navarrensis]MQX36529.1 hypothetical protein [Roseospira navarrensis]